jgi:hypothetical protein
LGDRLLALFAPRLELVLAGREAVELEVAFVVGHHVRGRGHHDEVCAHVRVKVTAEANDAFLLELEFARLAHLVDAEIERGLR